MRPLTIVLSLLWLLTAMPAMSQLPRFDAGLQAGPSFGWLRGNRAIDTTDPLWGAATGLTLQYDLSHLFGLRLGAGYQRKGMRSEVLFTDINANTVAIESVQGTLDYLMLPLMARASFGDRLRLSVGAGPYAGYLVRARQRYSGEGLDDVAVDNTGDLERWDMGVSASLGGSLSLAGNLWLNAEVRYDKGLANISALPVVDDGSIRTNAVCLLVGCSYRFGSAR